MEYSDGDRVELGNQIRTRRKAHSKTTARLAQMAGVSVRALQKAEKGEAGDTVLTKVFRTLDRLDDGEDIPDEQEVLRVEFRPGVWVTVDAADAATLGDLREVEARIRRLIEGNES
jgi:transcriptional regulator with XRE-family HTH domain